MYICLHIMYIYVYTHITILYYIYIHIYIYIFIYIYIHIYLYVNHIYFIYTRTLQENCYSLPFEKMFTYTLIYIVI